MRMGYCIINARQPNRKLLTEANLWVLVVFLELLVKPILSSWGHLGRAESHGIPLECWEEGNDSSQGCNYRWRRCLSKLFKHHAHISEESWRSPFWSLSYASPHHQRGSWSVNARMFPWLLGLINSRRHNRNWPLTTRSLKNLGRISPSKMPHLPFQLRPGKHFPLMSNSQFSVRGSAWCLEMTQISVFSVMGFFEESGHRGSERRCEGNVCQGAWQRPVWGLASRRAVSHPLRGRPVFHPGGIPWHHSSSYRKSRVPASATAIPWDPTQTYRRSSVLEAEDHEGKASSQPPPAGWRDWGWIHWAGRPRAAFWVHPWSNVRDTHSFFFLPLKRNICPSWCGLVG